MSTPQQITHSRQWIGPEVSSARAANCDSTRFVLVANDHFQLYDGQGKLLKDLPILASWEPRWDRTASGSLYYVSGHRLKLYNPDEGQAATVHVFDEYVEFDAEGRNGVSGTGESDLSADGDHFAMMGRTADGAIEVFAYSMKHGKGPAWRQSEPFDGLKITATNKIILSRADGLYVLGGSKLTSANGHAAVTTYEGRDKLLWDSNAESSAEHPWQHSIMMIDVDNPQDRRVLLNFGKANVATHISASDKGFCIVPVYDPTGKLPTQLLKVHLSGTVEEICRWDNPGPISENAQPKATVSADGTLVLFRRDDGAAVNTWMVRLDQPVVAPVIGPEETRIDYSRFVGKSEFVMIPRRDGAVDIVERKL